MRNLFILAILVTFSLADPWKIPKEKDQENSATRAKLAKELTGKQRTTVLAAWDAIRNGMSLSDVSDNIIAKSGLTAEEFNDATLKVEAAVADAEGVPPPEHHYMSNAEIAQATGISEEDVNKYSIDNSNNSFARSDPETPVDPSQDGDKGALIDLPPVSQAPPNIGLFSVNGMPNAQA